MYAYIYLQWLGSSLTSPLKPSRLYLEKRQVLILFVYLLLNSKVFLLHAVPFQHVQESLGAYTNIS